MVSGVNGHQRLVEAVAAAVVEVGDLLRKWRTDTEVCSGVWEGSQFKARADAMGHRALGERPAATEPRTRVISEAHPVSLAPKRPPPYSLIDRLDRTATALQQHTVSVQHDAPLEAH